MCVFDCNDLTAESTEKYLPSDRRFWLLTIIAGFFGPNDFPLLEDKLAKLYRIAFMRQQARHLGIENRTHDDTQSLPINLNNFAYHNRRRKRRVTTGNFTELRFLRKRHKFIAKRNAENWNIENDTNSSENDSIVMNNVNNGSDAHSIVTSETNTTSKNGKFVQKNRDPNKVEILIHNVTYLTADELRKIAEQEVDSNLLRYPIYLLNNTFFIIII